MIVAGKSTFGQETLKPEIGNTPDISAAAVKKHNANLHRYEAIGNKIGDGSADQDDVAWYNDMEIDINTGPFSTSNAGCDWYCAGIIKSVEATSTLPVSSETNYEAVNLHDFDLRTTWATDVNGGVNASIKFCFPPSEILSVTHLEIYNGYQKSETAWKNNSRAKKMEVFINGKSTYFLELQDTIKMQRFHIGQQFSPKGEDLVIELKVLEVYKGGKYQDLCISEINFDGEGDH